MTQKNISAFRAFLKINTSILLEIPLNFVAFRSIYTLMNNCCSEWSEIKFQFPVRDPGKSVNNTFQF